MMHLISPGSNRYLLVLLETCREPDNVVLDAALRELGAAYSVPRLVLEVHADARGVVRQYRHRVRRGAGYGMKTTQEEQRAAERTKKPSCAQPILSPKVVKFLGARKSIMTTSETSFSFSTQNI